MSQTLTDIAKKLSTPVTTIKRVKAKGQKKKQTKVQVTDVTPIPKVQLIYAFNGSGKTRLSREFKQLVSPKGNDNREGDEVVSSWEKIIYYNAFTEDLFYWDNDLEGDAAPKLKIQPNSYTNWLLKLLIDLGQDANIVKYFQHFTNDKLTPHFSADFAEVTFTLERGDNKGMLWSTKTGQKIKHTFQIQLGFCSPELNAVFASYTKSQYKLAHPESHPLDDDINYP